MKNTLIQEDIERLVDVSPILRDFQDATVLVTGATGLLGSQIVLALLENNKQHQSGVTVIALVRNQEKAEKVFSAFLDNPYLIILEADIQSSIEISETVDYVIHGASVTDSSSFVTSPVDTIKTAITGTENLLELAVKKQVKGFLYLSSLEVYGITDTSLAKISETDYGFLDPLSVRSSYSEGKRMVECLCVAYLNQHGIPVKIARLAQTFGPGVSYSDNRVFAQFARSVIEGQDIILRTTGETVRNYCYTMDAVHALFYILLKGEAGQAYNVANKNTAISIKDMAALVIKNFSRGSSTLVFDLVDSPEKLGYNPVVKIELDTSKLERLGWFATVDLEDMYARLIGSMRSEQIESGGVSCRRS